jgi:Tol biopolymer transport system component
MSLAPGARLGPYEVTGAIGAGGMGQVYRGRDTRLNRDVALKILPATFAQDPERLARFRREAQVLASLNHQNIAAIYGLEESGSQFALVLELVEGRTLADRIARGPLALEESLPIARQIVAALEEAHSRGVIHRDLKPANISLREDGTVKVLDFGLAKLTDPVGTSSPSASDLANSPTMTSPAMTGMGMILGTAAYMSPEQAKGRVVDKRADIWAFGCVLYEMLTGRRAFEGEEVTDMMAAILRGEPDWTALPAEAPAPLQRLLRRCLVKDPARRLPDIGAARLDIEDALAAPPEEVRAAASSTPLAAVPPRAAARWPERAALGLVTLALAALALVHFRERPDPQSTFRFQVTPAQGTLFAGGGTGAAPVVSPDGRLLVFRTARPGQPLHLWLRNLETMETRELSGTLDAAGPFWSPDSRSIAFFADRKLKRLDVSGGAPQTLADLQGQGVSGGAWSPDGSTIVFGGGAAMVLMRMPAAGGPMTPVTTLDAARKEIAHFGPVFLPDGRRFLFSVIPGGIELGSIDTPERTRLLDLNSSAAYAPPGYLLFVSQDRLVAQPFDASRGELHGEAVPLAEQVSPDPMSFTVSTTGVLVYRSGQSQIGGVPIWVDRSGREIGPIAEGLGAAQYPRISPDGQRLAVVSDGDIWVHDLRGRPPIRLTFDGREHQAFSPLWTPDGRRLVYEQGGRTGAPGLWALPADGSERAATRASPEGHFHPHGWSADGRELIAVEYSTSAPPDIVAISVAEPFEKRPVVQTPAHEGANGAALSSDGRWLAYVADTTGAAEIWIRPFPGPGAAVRVSPDGGVEPLWSRSGRELFYRQTGKVMAVSIEAEPELQFTAPRMLFDGEYEFRRAGSQPPTYDVAADGRFIFLKPLAPIQAQPLTVVVNWVDELERRLRAP